MNLKFLITHVDRYGYCGRDHHPVASDVGLMVLPVDMKAYWETDGGPDFTLDDMKDVKFGEVAGCTRVWTCVTEDNRILELMDHEIEIHEDR